jgi:nucleoside-triphosphatase THEP1
MARGKIFLVSGPSGCGKTSFCNHFLEALHEAPMNPRCIRGILSLPLMQENDRCGILAMDLRSGERRLLATRNHGARDGIHTARWRFDPQTLRWCNQVLAAAIPCDLLLIDELGPLEFEQGRGCLEGLKAVDSGQFQLALVVVRTRLLERAMQRWPDAGRIDLGELGSIEGRGAALLQCLGGLDRTP